MPAVLELFYLLTVTKASGPPVYVIWSDPPPFPKLEGVNVSVDSIHVTLEEAQRCWRERRSASRSASSGM
jgi:sugar/nucleoside kinase (ribokinase family)